MKAMKVIRKKIMGNRRKVREDQKMSGERGQVALILVLAATVAGTLVVSLADRSTRDIRTQSLDAEKVKALKGAESGIEQALLSEGSVSDTVVEGGEVSFAASYINEGGNGFISSEMIEPGDVFDVLVEGGDSSVSELKIYFSSESSSAALKVAEYRVDESIDSYVLNTYAFDGDDERVLVNNFDDPIESSIFNFKDEEFSNRASVVVNANGLVPPVTKLVRVTILYAATRIGIGPVGGNLPGQQVKISSVGSYSVSADSSVKKRLELNKEMEKVPGVFDKVLYSNSRLIQ
jgi:hypothetical protein